MRQASVEMTALLLMGIYVWAYVYLGHDQKWCGLNGNLEI